MGRKEQIIVLITAAGMAVLIYLIVFSSHGYLDYRRLKQKEKSVSNRVEMIDAENRQLEDQIKSLKTDPEYIKHIAKHEQDMAEEEDIIFKYDQKKKRDDHSEW